MLKHFKLFILLFIGFISKYMMVKIDEEGDRQKSLRNLGIYQKKIGDSFYQFHGPKKNWHDAKRVCGQQGASLFYAENSSEAEAVISFWKALETRRRTVKPPEDYSAYPDDLLRIWVPLIFVGISDIKNKGTFKTVDGKPISEVYHKWLPGEPNYSGGNQNCVQMNKEGKMNDIRCNRPLNFICKLSRKKKTRKNNNNNNNRNTDNNNNNSNDDNNSKNMRSLSSNNSMITVKMFVFWPNATVPFYINPDHFNEEQVKTILKSLEMFKFKTCIKFSPVMSVPSEGQHVMTFINPKGVRRCKIEMKGHLNYDSHSILLGYNCIDSPQLDMLIMRALGLPFEHNRMDRDFYIDVLIENIEPSYIQLFTKDSNLPEALLKIPYDQHSVMHFGERDYSKNGHRTIKFKEHACCRESKGLTDSDIKKIALIYGAECVTRDRAEKVATCRQLYS